MGEQYRRGEAYHRRIDDNGESERIKERRKKSHSELVKLTGEAKMAGMSYGEYVSLMEMKGGRFLDV